MKRLTAILLAIALLSSCGPEDVQIESVQENHSAPWGVPVEQTIWAEEVAALSVVEADAIVELEPEPESEPEPEPEPLPASLRELIDWETLKIPLWVDGVELTGLLLEDTPLVRASDLMGQWPDFRPVTLTEEPADGSGSGYFRVKNLDSPLEGYAGGQGVYFAGQTEEYWIPISEAAPGWARLWDEEQKVAYLTNPRHGSVSRAETQVPVLMYHEVSDDVFGLEYLFVSPASMRQQLQFLVDNGYDTIFFSDLTHLEDYDKPIILTFDDSYIGNYEALYPLLQEFGLKATIFVVTGTVGTDRRLTAEQLREMYDSGLVDIQSHTVNHIKLGDLAAEEQEYQMRQSQIELARITRHIPYALSYPQGSYNSDTLELAKQHFLFGMTVENDIWRASDDHFLISRITIERDTSMWTFQNELP